MKLKAFIAVLLCALALLTLPACDPASSTEPPASSKGDASLEQSVASPSEKPAPSPVPSSKNEPSAFAPAVDPALTGSWVTAIDMSRAMRETYKAGMGEQVSPYMNFEELSFVLEVTMTFTADGKTTASCNAEKPVEGLVQFIGNGMKRYLVAAYTAEAEKQGMTITEFFAAAGVADGNAYIDAEVSKIMAEQFGDKKALADQIAQSFENAGSYGAENGRIYIYKEQADEKSYNLYTVKDGVLTVDLSEENKQEIGDMAAYYPMTFKKS